MRHPRRSALLIVALALTASVLAGTPARADLRGDTPPPTTTEPGATPNIVGGSLATAGQFPFTVALIRRGVTSRFDGFSCGASVLSRSWVVTAAHCLVDYRGDYPGQEYVGPNHFDVLAGTHLLTGTGGQRLRVASVHVHPSYSFPQNDYDVALLRLARPTSAPEVPVIAAPTAALDDPGKMATTVGWGVTSYGNSNPSSTQRFVSVPILSDAACSSAYPPGFADEYGNPLEYRSNMLCAGFAGGGKDACQGDSGGPLLGGSAETSWHLIGIVSFGNGCAEAAFPGVYHRTWTTMSWLSRTRRFGPFAPDANAFIARQFYDFAGRLPTSSEAARWRSTLEAQPASTMITALTDAPAWDGNARMNVRLYRAAFLRNPDTSGLEYWVRQRWGGRGPVSIANHFTASSEFRAKYGALSNDAFVTRIYQNVFGRNPDPGGRSYWNGKLASGTGRGQMLYELSNSSEYRRTTDSLVRTITTSYGLLRTVPTATEIADRQALSHRELVDLLRTSFRYASRFDG